jgi:hypothetical protein
VSQENLVILESPTRVSHSYTQHYDAPAHAAFALCCPVRECDWVDGWDPTVVWTDSGLVEERCTWLMPDGAVWTTIEHDPAEGRLRLLKVVPSETVCDIQIEVRSTGEASCELDLVYTHTAIGEAGRDLCAALSEEAFAEFAQGWQEAMARGLSSR